jgi:PknH-like extracellular domain
LAAVGWCVLVAVQACGQPEAANETSSEPAGLVADSLLVNVDDLRRVTGFKDFDSTPGFDVHQPTPDPATAGPCRAVFDQQYAFGTGWKQFRSVTYSGTTNTAVGQAHGIAVVTQAVGVYPDEAAARTAFDRLGPELTACSATRATNYEFTMTKPDPSTLSLDSGKWHVTYRVDSSAMVDVTVMGLSNRDRIALDVMDTITDRIS